MKQVHFDKCFLDGELILYKDLPQVYKEKAENRFSYTDLDSLNLCPRMFYEDDIDFHGAKDTSAHGIMGHFIQGEYISNCLTKSSNTDMCFLDFEKQALSLAKKALTFNKSRDRDKIIGDYPLLKEGFIRKMYVTRMFNTDNYLTKIQNMLTNLSEIHWLIAKGTYKNLYIETGVYQTLPDGSIIFGKVDLMIEHFTSDFTLVDHKSSFNTLYLKRMQLPIYAALLNKPIRNLILNDMSKGDAYHYPKPIKPLLLEAAEFINSALESTPKDVGANIAKIGIQCKTCGVLDCMSRETDDEGYLSI